MSDCQRFEIAIDQRLRDALADDEASALEAHCATCEGCRAYEASARRMELGLHTLASDARDAIDWDRMEESIRTALRARMRKLVAGVVIGAVAVALSTWGFAPAGEAALFALEVGALVASIVLVRALLTLREVRRVSSLARGSELISRHRAMLEKQVRTIRQFRWLALAVAVWCIWNAARSVDVRHVVVHAALACIVVGSWLHTLLVSYPRLRRELAELGIEDPR